MADSVVVACNGSKRRKTCSVMDGEDVTIWECKKNRNGTWSCKQLPDVQPTRTGPGAGLGTDVVRAVLDAKSGESKTGNDRARTRRRR
jgi:hypothetical protein